MRELLPSEIALTSHIYFNTTLAMRTPLLSADAVQQRLQALPGWTVNGNLTPHTLTRTFNFTASVQSPFLRGLEFIKQVAARAESIDHHPDIFYTYDKVKLTLTTHDSQGLTEKDFELAALIGSIKTDSVNI